MIECVKLRSINITLPLGLLYLDEDVPVMGCSSEGNMRTHMPLLEGTIDLLLKSGFEIVACVCGRKDDTRGCGNMYLLFRGDVTFSTQPDGFVTVPFFLEDGIEFTVLCPSDYEPDMPPPEMQDYFSAKATVLHQWASINTAPKGETNYAM